MRQLRRGRGVPLRTRHPRSGRQADPGAGPVDGQHAGQQARPHPGGDPAAPRQSDRRGHDRDPDGQGLRQPGAGRPAKVFVITDAGRSAFEHAYDDLAANALRYIAEIAGPEAVTEFARRQVSELERRYAPAVARGALAERVQALSEALSADGYAASAGPAPAIGHHGSAGEQICQHHCPVAHVAAEFPQLCEAETEAFGRLLGTPVQRLATIAHGDGICTTHVTGSAANHGTRGPGEGDDPDRG